MTCRKVSSVLARLRAAYWLVAATEVVAIRRHAEECSRCLNKIHQQLAETSRMTVSDPAFCAEFEHRLAVVERSQEAWT